MTQEYIEKAIKNLQKQVAALGSGQTLGNNNNEQKAFEASMKADMLKTETEAAISEAWNPKKLYKPTEDAYVLDDNMVWICKFPNVGQKPSTSPIYWEHVNLVSELNKLNNEIKKLKESE